MKIFFLIIWFFTFQLNINAQEKNDKIYSSLSEALVNPEIVEHLDLHKQKLKSFPVEILLLKNLKTLNLSKNKIDVLPTEIYELSKLEKLNVSHNKLYTLPYNIGQLINTNNIINGFK